MKNPDWAELGRASTDLISHLVANSELLGKTAAEDIAQLRRDAFSAYDATLDDLRDLGKSFRASPRYFRLATLAARVAARHRLALARQARLPASDALAAAHRQSAEDIRDACAELGGGVLKVGQLLSARADLLPRPYIEALRTLQDQAPARPFADIAHVLELDLGRPVCELFADVESEAIAAASLAQVHAARLHDGREVVIKIQRPGVDDLVRADLRALRLVVKLAGDSLPGLDIETTLAEVSRFLACELDFDLEATRQARFTSLCEADDRWHVPSIVASHCGARVIVMERIEGRSLSSHLEDASPGEAARVIALLIELLADQVLQTGLAHGDPHPGNILVEPTGRLVFVDFGCVLEIAREERRAYVALVMAIVSRDPSSIAAALAAAGFSAEAPEVLVSLAEMFLEAFEPGRLAAIDPAEQITRALELARAAGSVSVPPSFVLIGRIFALVGGLVLHHRPAIDLPVLLARALR